MNTISGRPTGLHRNEMDLLQHWRRFGGGGGAINGKGGSGNVSGGGRGNTSSGGGPGNRGEGFSRTNAERGWNERNWQSASDRNIYSDIKVADPATQKILNPNPYGGIITQKDGRVYSTGNDDLSYNKARDEWNARTFGDRLANFLAPFGLTSVEPVYNRPATYAGGEFHTGINPAAAAASALGTIAGLNPVAGMIISTGAGQLYDLAGGSEPVLTGPRTIYADDGTGGTAAPWSPSVSRPSTPTAPSTAGGERSSSGTIGSMTPALLSPVAAPEAARTVDEPSEETPPAPTGRTVAAYPYDPLRYGEAAGEWRYFSPDNWPVNAADGGPINGPGDGQDDKIPALLSNNEHVIDALTVAAAGRGDSDAGHRVIEQWKRDVRKRAGLKNPEKAKMMKGSIGSLRSAA